MKPGEYKLKKVAPPPWRRRMMSAHDNASKDSHSRHSSNGFRTGSSTSEDVDITHSDEEGDDVVIEVDASVNAPQTHVGTATVVRADYFGLQWRCVV